jgi:hypothetical protein
VLQRLVRGVLVGTGDPMTFIAEGGGRTVDNCFVHDRRKVYEVVASRVLDVCKSECNEVVKTGEQVTDQIVYHLIAESEELARALYERHYGSKFQRHTLISIKPLFVIDGEVSHGHR